MIHPQLVPFRVVQELLEDIQSVSSQIGFQTFGHLVDSLLYLPSVLVSQDLVLLTIKSEELFLVLVRNLADIDVCMLTAIREAQLSILAVLNWHKISFGWIFDRILHEGVVLPWLFVVVHLDARVVLFD